MLRAILDGQTPSEDAVRDPDALSTRVAALEREHEARGALLREILATLAANTERGTLVSVVPDQWAAMLREWRERAE